MGSDGASGANLCMQGNPDSEPVRAQQSYGDPGGGSEHMAVFCMRSGAGGSVEDGAGSWVLKSM